MRYQFILHIDLSMISDTVLIRACAPLSLPHKKKSLDRRRTFLIIIFRPLSRTKRIARRLVIRTCSVTADFNGLCRTSTAFLIDARHDRTRNAVTITARLHIVRKRRIDRFIKERRTARLTVFFRHPTANVYPIRITNTRRIM